MTAGLPLMKNVFIPLTRGILVPLGLTAAASATDAAIFLKNFESGATALIFLNKEMENIMKIVKSLKESGLLIKGISETIKNKAKEQNDGFLGMLLGTLSASLLGSILSRQGIIRAGEETIRVNQKF